MPTILREDLDRIIRILADWASWETVGARTNFVRSVLSGTDRGDALVRTIQFDSSPIDSARDAVLKIQDAGIVYFKLFLSALQSEVFDGTDIAFLKELLESHKAVGGAEVPPDTMVFEVGRFKTLARIGKVMELAMAGTGAGAGIIIFQGDVKLDCTPGFLMRLRWDQDNGVPLYVTPEMRPWANWEQGKQVELTDCPTDGDADPNGSKRTDWCLEVLMKRFSRPDQRRRGDVRQEFLRLVGELEHKTYLLIHSLDASEPLENLEAFLRNYLSFWKSLDLSSLPGIRFLVLIRVDAKGHETQNLRAVRDAVAQVLGRPSEELAAGGILAEGAVGLSFHPKLEDVSQRDAERWLEKLHGKIDEAQHKGALGWEEADLLKREVEEMVNKPLFSAEDGPKKMKDVEPVLRRTYDRFLTALGRERRNV